MIMWLKWRAFLLAMALCLACAGVRAAPENITDGELELTPPYCKDVQGIRWGDAYYNKSPRADYWVGIMGKSFWALHHYCWALINLRRAQEAGTPPAIRKGLWENVLGDCYYVIKNSTPDFVLLPEIYVRIGDTQMLLSNPGAAYVAYDAARKIKPDYWPPYVRWADVLIKINQKAEAKKLIAEGLQHAPDAQQLIAKYRQLGGDPRDIVPIPKPAAAASSDASTAADPAADAPASAAGS